MSSHVNAWVLQFGSALPTVVSRVARPEPREGRGRTRRKSHDFAMVARLSRGSGRATLHGLAETMIKAVRESAYGEAVKQHSPGSRSAPWVSIGTIVENPERVSHR